MRYSQAYARQRESFPFEVLQGFQGWFHGDLSKMSECQHVRLLPSTRFPHVCASWGCSDFAAAADARLLTRLPTPPRLPPSRQCCCTCPRMVFQPRIRLVKLVSAPCKPFGFIREDMIIKLNNFSSARSSWTSHYDGCSPSPPAKGRFHNRLTRFCRLPGST